MLDNQRNGKFSFECDGCADALDANSTDLDMALRELKVAEWAWAKDGDSWKHFCRDCKLNTRLRLQ